MGFLSWRGWDRLDGLDHRTGIRRQPTEASIQRSQRLLWAITVWVFLAAVVSVVQRNWAWAFTLFVTSVVSVFMNRRAIRRLRERLP